jgi:hypothetical protein
MSPELIASVLGAAIVAWGAFTALRAPRAQTRLGVLSGMVTAAVFVLLIRLVTPFGGWSDWFTWVWLAGMLAIVIAVFRAALVWPDLPWRAEESKARRTEATGLGFSALLAVLIAGALVLPGLFV